MVVSEGFIRGALNVCVSIGAWFSEEVVPFQLQRSVDVEC